MIIIMQRILFPCTKTSPVMLWIKMVYVLQSMICKYVRLFPIFSLETRSTHSGRFIAPAWFRWVIFNSWINYDGLWWSPENINYNNGHPSRAGWAGVSHHIMNSNSNASKVKGKCQNGLLNQPYLLPLKAVVIFYKYNAFSASAV